MWILSFHVFLVTLFTLYESLCSIKIGATSAVAPRSVFRNFLTRQTPPVHHPQCPSTLAGQC